MPRAMYSGVYQRARHATREPRALGLFGRWHACDDTILLSSPTAVFFGYHARSLAKMCLSSEPAYYWAAERGWPGTGAVCHLCPAIISIYQKCVSLTIVSHVELEVSVKLFPKYLAACRVRQMESVHRDAMGWHSIQLLINHASTCLECLECLDGLITGGLLRRYLCSNGRELILRSDIAA
ncbi:hypothetical protein BKA93DRAFT_619084 [Sparassis latifolia]